MSDENIRVQDALQDIEEQSKKSSVQSFSLGVSELEPNTKVFLKTYTEEKDKALDAIHAQGWADRYKHKNYWSWFLMGIMAAMIGFQIALICLVGLGYFNFEKYKWFLPTIMLQYLIQAVGLVTYVVKHLFKEINENSDSIKPKKSSTSRRKLSPSQDTEQGL